MSNLFSSVYQNSNLMLSNNSSSKFSTFISFLRIAMFPFSQQWFVWKCFMEHIKVKMQLHFIWQHNLFLWSWKERQLLWKKEQNITLSQVELLAPILPCAYLWTFWFLCLWCHAYLPRDPYLQSPASQRRKKWAEQKNV